MAELFYPASAVGLAGAVLPALVPMRYTGQSAAGLASGLGRDWRHARDNSGTIAGNNRVMVKPEATAPEIPMAGARVRLHRLVDGYCAWEGISDASGYYWPRGLEVGVEYIAVGIDPYRNHKATGAGPVVATEAAP